MANKQLTPLYVEVVNMDGLTNEEVDRYLAENPRIVPLFEIDIMETETP